MSGHSRPFRPLVASDDVHALVSAHLQRPDSSWSIGGFGAIAEFHHLNTAPTTIHGARARSRLGAIEISPSVPLRAIAYELPSARPDYWHHGIVLCMPRASAVSKRTGFVVALGPDHESLRDEESGAPLFDLGVGAETFRFCVRTGDSRLLRALERACDRPFAESAGELGPLLVGASPTRVALCAAGRIEVYQPIAAADGRTPDGPHTHLIPRLLRPHQTHSTNIPVPSGLVPVATLYPAHPLTDSFGRRKSFARTEHEAFQALLVRFGDAACVAAKNDIVGRVHAAARPEAWQLPVSRHARLAARVGLRQVEHEGGDYPGLRAWRQQWDAASARASSGRLSELPAH